MASEDGDDAHYWGNFRGIADEAHWGITDDNR